MKKTISAAAAVLVPLVLMGLSSCNSTSDGEHGHGTHDHSSQRATGGAVSDSADSASPADSKAVEGLELKAIEPSGDYPLTTCVVGGGPLAAMGGPLAFTYGGEEVQLCCKGCIAEFEESPEKFLAKVRAAKK